MHLDLSMLGQYTLIRKQKSKFSLKIQVCLAEFAVCNTFNSVNYPIIQYTEQKKSYKIGVKTGQ